ILILALLFSVSGLVVEVTPGVFDPDGSRSLTVNCTFSRGVRDDVTAVVSLIVSRSQYSSSDTFIDLASINEYSSNQVNVFGSENTTATGSIDPQKNSFISLYWDSPSTREAGNYRCSAQGITSVGHSIVETEDAEVRLLLRPDDHQLNRTKLLQDRLKSIDLRLSEFKNSTDKEMSALKQDITKSDTFIAEIRRRFETIQSTLFDRPVRYENSRYYVSKHNWRYPSLDESMCDLLGGSLLEISDVNEFKAVSDFLRNDSAFDGVLTGGSHEDKEGAYVFMGSGREMVYKNWAPGEPKGTRDENCVVLLKQYGWQMAVKPCFDNRLNYRFVCETEL
ncbi:unnamed protein product, partial [Lymnaea stagnalis]